MDISLLTEKVNKESFLIEKWIQRWGKSISQVVLDGKCDFFCLTDVEGLIGYRIEYGCAVIFGDPICAIEDAPRLALAFQSYCQERNMNFVYLISSEEFAKWAINNLCEVMIQVGDELIFDPQSDFKDGHKGYKLRNKENHARKIGLSVEEYVSTDYEIEQEIEQAASAWLKARRGPQISLGPLSFFENRKDKRYFYIKDAERIIGAAMLSRIEMCQGWLLKFLVTVPKAPRGASELLMISILDHLRKENCHFLTYGMVPAKYLGEMKGLGKVSSWLAHTVFILAKWFFNLSQRKQYWQKFRPKTEPVYLLIHKKLGLQEIRAIMKVLTIS